VNLLHGSDGLTNAGRYQFAAHTIENAGYTVLLPRYLEATGNSRARYGDIRSKFPIWQRTLESVLANPPPGTEPGRVAVVGFSLGGALALSLRDRRESGRSLISSASNRPGSARDGTCPRH